MSVSLSDIIINNNVLLYIKEMIKNRYIFRSVTCNPDASITEYINKNTKTVSASDIYIIDSHKSFFPQDLNKLSEILNAENISNKKTKYLNSLIIVQRTAHLSPWSEKASQILISCGFNADITIEKLTL